MAGDADIQSLNRTLKELVTAVKEQNRILKAANHNLIEIFKNDNDVVEDQPVEGAPAGTPRLLGWNTAASLQIDGKLLVGDMKYEQDESQWIWTGDIWERIDAPSS